MTPDAHDYTAQLEGQLDTLRERIAGLEARLAACERTAAELRASEARFRETFERAPIGLAHLADDGRWLQANRCLRELLGYTEGELRALRFQDIAHPEDAPSGMAAANRLRAGEIDVDTGERRYLRKDGSLVWVQGTIWHVPASANQAAYFVLAVEDVTARKQAQAALLREKVFTDAVIDSVPGLLYLYDADGYLVRWNKKHEEITGYSDAELDHRHVLDWYKGRPDDVARITAGVQRALAEGFADAEAGLVTKSGAVIPFYFTAVRLVIDGKTYFTGIGIDLTERQRAQQEKEKLAAQLQQSQKMEAIGQLAGGIAHDFNNILTAIFGHLELVDNDLAAKVAADDALRQGVQQALRAAERAAGLTRQLLAFSRRQVSQPTVLQLNRILAEMDKLLKRLLTENIAVCFHLAPDAQPIRADVGQVEQVIMNLVVNARDAMPSGGHLTLETTNVVLDGEYVRAHPEVSAGNYVCLVVRDTGCGMDAATLEHVFEPFFTTKPVGQGTGLGLATVYGIVKQGGGHISAHSEAGRGTTFRVYWPTVDAPVTPLAAEPEQRAETGGSETVLLCEDDPAVRQVAAQFLREAGYRVLVAERGALALQLAARHVGPIHLLVTDVIMPDMNGRRLAEALVERRNGVRTLYISGYPANVIAQHGVLEEGVEFLEKPFSRQRLLQRVRAVLDGPGAASVNRS